MLKKVVSIVTFTVLFVMLASFVLIQALIYKGAQPVSIGELTDNDIDYVIVLGAALWDDRPSPTLYNRLVIANEFLKENNVKIIATGGLGEGDTITEAEGIKRFLLDKGINEGRIYKEEFSTSTFENLRNSKNIIASIDDREHINILIVTSDFHVFRSKLIARRLGFAVFGLPAETPTSTRNRMIFREYFAVINTVLFER
ncbi:MAG: YdcF family protein [Alkaliphilus sp.]